ncbi:MAG TPA: bifunctional riboflavin kinase/FAD synthetase [Anaeromyxobacteraceae bacterium]|nr:bifunctional riboflavin kinase/FAD synthetase [Anaeromyxobacteraceae bacterium]
MEVFRSIEDAGSLRGCAVAIGNFDGVHIGHRRLFERTRALATARGAKAAVLTFDPHPVRVLRPELAPPLLTPLPRRLELFAECGLDAAVVQTFDRDYARTTAEEFVSRDLADRLGASDVVVGYDFTAGRDRVRGRALRPLLDGRGITLEVVEPVTSDGLVASSTKIREFLLEGLVDAAAQLLARPYDVDGVAERGAGLGRGIGFATANVRSEAMLPANGVYAVRVLLQDPGGAFDPRPLEGVCNVGTKPTVQASGPVVAEVHLLDFADRDLYDQRLRIAFIARLRDERRFPSLDALRAQIAQDVGRARELLRQQSPM